jgi:lysyl-tRNA synthetase class 1
MALPTLRISTCSLHFGAETLVSAPGEPLMSTIDPAASPSDLRTLAEQSNAWPFEQAKAIVARLKKKPKDEVLFETGYGPSGLPHIGTFGEVARTTMVRHAFRVLTEDKVKTRLLAFSDDMDGLRKVPDNVPNKEMLTAYLGKPLTRLPRSLQIRLRVRQFDGLLHFRPFRRRDAAHARGLRSGDGYHPANARA